jgi:phenol 2-monooxygenase
MIGDSTDAVWGVMDVYPRTNFPDIRKKTIVQSAAGSLLNIPREGGSMNRFYVELPAGTTAKDVKIEEMHAHAQKVFHPYTMDIADTFWWSAYLIGRRLADHFTKDDRVFLTGDAFHTHSPKAGQGMNVSLQDGYNIGWKLALILKGQVNPNILETYALERGKTAADLIAFDRSFATAFASRTPKETGSSKFRDVFIQSGRYTAGLQVTYDDSPLTWVNQSSQNLAKNLVVGMRFPSAQVVKHCDAQAIQFVKALPADGRWRIVVFAGDTQDGPSLERLNKVSSMFQTHLGNILTKT